VLNRPRFCSFCTSDFLFVFVTRVQTFLYYVSALIIFVICNFVSLSRSSQAVTNRPMWSLAIKIIQQCISSFLCAFTGFPPSDFFPPATVHKKTFACASTWRMKFSFVFTVESRYCITLSFFVTSINSFECSRQRHLNLSSPFLWGGNFHIECQRRVYESNKGMVSVPISKF